MERNVFLSVVLCAGIFFAWQHFYLKPITDKQAQEIRLQQTQSQAVGNGSQTNQVASSNQSAVISKGASSEKYPVRTITLAKPDSNYKTVISSVGGRVTEVFFPEYKGRKIENVKYLIGGARQLEISATGNEWTYLSNVNYRVLEEGKSPEGFPKLILGYDDESISIRRTYLLNSDRYSLEHSVSLQFKKNQPQFVFVGVQAIRDIPKEHAENERREIIFNKTAKQATWSVGDISELKEDMGEGNWVGFSSRYFLNALVDRTGTKPNFQARPVDGGQVLANLVYRINGNSAQFSQAFYYGPKEMNTLKAVGSKLDMAVDFGWFTFFAYPLLQMLKWFYAFVHNYGIAIILLTIVVKVLTYPLTYKSMKSMKEMQKVQPQIQKLREKHGDDKEKLNREMLELMKTHGYNPMSGCLPIFIQMPVFIALYNVLYGAIDLYNEPFFGWIMDLSSKDPYFVTPVLLGALMFLQQKLTPSTAADPAQQKMLMFMPLIFSFMMLWLPAGLTLYMLINSVTSIVQQVVINKKLGIAPSSAVVAT